jgi:hypothetical protein
MPTLAVRDLLGHRALRGHRMLRDRVLCERAAVVLRACDAALGKGRRNRWTQSTDPFVASRTE